jgi:GntR family transcriptional repressor for pyruvate dehydrogenase complex
LDETLERLAALIANVPLGTIGEPRLPTERELASVLDINRGTLRERLAALEILGLIRRKQGSGTYLGMPHPTFIRLYFEMAVKLGYVEVGQLQQARELIEREVAGLAATHASAEDVATLERCVERMLNSENVENGDQADYEFHMTMVLASRNPVMVLMTEGLSSVLRQLLQLRRHRGRQDPDRIGRMNAIHIPILEAVRDHDPERAVAAMDEHFRVWNEIAREFDGLEGHAEAAS